MSYVIQQGKRRLDAHATEELWDDWGALNAWIRLLVEEDCEAISMQIEPDSEIVCVREGGVSPNGSFLVVVLYRSAPGSRRSAEGVNILFKHLP